MIDLGRPSLHALGVSVFCDHADPARFHFLPDSPRLRLRPDGTPELSLLKYELDPALHQALGAGLLSLTVDLAVSDDVQKQLQQKLARQFSLAQPVQLDPVTVEDGTCSIVVIDRPSDAGLVERVLGAGTPTLYGDEACTFVMVLDPDGVSLVEQALAQGGLPAGVVYRLGVLGLRPALRARITASWQDIYHYYDNRLHGGKLLLAIDIGATIEELVHAEAITIAVDQLVPADQQDPAYQSALDQAQRYVLEQFFRPTLGQQPPPPDSSSGALATIGSAIKDFAGFFSLTYSLVDVNRDELKTLSYDLTAAQAERLTLAPQGSLSLLVDPAGAPPGFDPARLITTVPAVAASQMDFDVGVAIDLAAERIDHVEVLLGYGTHAPVDLVLDAGAPRKTASFFREEALGSSVSYHYEVSFSPGGGLNGLLRSQDVTSASRVLRINPRELYQRIAVTAIAQGVPFARFPLVIVDVQVPDPAGGGLGTQTLQLDAAHAQAGFVIRASLGARVPLLRRIRYVDTQGVETLVDWESFEAGVLVIGDPFPDVLDVQILGSARFGTNVSRLVVELRPTAHPEQVASRILTQAQPSATWSLALADREDPGYEYRVTVQTVRGEVQQGSWLAGSGDTLVVGEGIARLRQIRLMFVGRSLQDLGLLGVKVRFAYDDPASSLHAEDEMMMTDASKTVDWSYPIADPAKQTYTYQLTLVHSDGGLEVRDPVNAADLLLIIPLT
jgi:hypothetical protein